MLDVLIYFIIAAVVCTMLYMVLGKQVGESPDTPLFGEDGPSLSPEPEAPPVKASRHFDGPAGGGLGEIARADKSFNPDRFLDNAKAAYAMILEGYADGDKETLEMLLSADMYAAYAAAIDERDERGLTQTTDLARIISAEFISAAQAGKDATIAVEYEAEIASALTNAEGDVVEGDLDRLARATEVWTYTRNLSSKNPNWALISVEEAGDDTLGSAPDFTPDDA